MGSRGASGRGAVLPAGVDPRCRGAGGSRGRPEGTPAGDRPQARDNGGPIRRGHAGGASGASVGRRANRPPDQRVGGPPLSRVRSPRADDLLPKVRLADAQGTLFGLRPEGAREYPADRGRRDARAAAEQCAARAEGGLGGGGGVADPVRRELCSALSPLPSEPLHTSADTRLLHRDRRVLEADLVCARPSHRGMVVAGVRSRSPGRHRLDRREVPEARPAVVSGRRLERAPERGRDPHRIHARRGGALHRRHSLAPREPGAPAAHGAWVRDLLGGASGRRRDGRRRGT